jgi:4-carboxymuconolactone decarboxylase
MWMFSDEVCGGPVGSSQKIELKWNVRATWVLGLSLALALPVCGQDRMPKIPREKLTPAQQKAIDQRRADQQARSEACRDPKMDPAKCTAEYFDIHGPMVPLLRSPDVMVAVNSMGNYLEFKTALPPKIRELVILLAAREWTQQYVWNSHFKSALNRGLEPEIIKAVSDGRRPNGMSDQEDAAYEFYYELHKNRSVSDATYARALANFGEQGIIDMISTDGFYSLLSMVMNVSRTPLPKSASAPPLVALPN